MMTLLLHSYFTITIEDDKYTAAQKEKMFIADIDKAGRKGYNATTIKGNVFTARTRSLESILYPQMELLAANAIENKWISSQKKLQLTIK
jgi:hypothetical protein